MRTVGIAVSAALVVALVGGTVAAGTIPVLTNNDIKTIMHNLGWGDATVTTTDQGANGVDFEITWSGPEEGWTESKLSWGTNSKTETSNLSVTKNWSGYDQYAILVTWISSTETEGTVEAEVFMNDNSWGWHQPPRPVIYWDLTTEIFARNDVPRVGFQFISKDLPGETVVMRVKGTNLPEPASMGLLALGGLAALLKRKRR
jgi:hypothetical protein